MFSAVAQTALLFYGFVHASTTSESSGKCCCFRAVPRSSQSLVTLNDRCMGLAEAGTSLRSHYESNDSSGSLRHAALYEVLSFIVNTCTKPDIQKITKGASFNVLKFLEKILTVAYVDRMRACPDFSTSYKRIEIKKLRSDYEDKAMPLRKEVKAKIRRHLGMDIYAYAVSKGLANTEDDYESYISARYSGYPRLLRADIEKLERIDQEKWNRDYKNDNLSGCDYLKILDLMRGLQRDETVYPPYADSWEFIDASDCADQESV
ncbi:hypothetical protein PAPHI01_1404 [Pancytospora philotis]|nr:hypothetical protein PAPHI01_1404 [Pancytospora philotis]